MVYFIYRKGMGDIYIIPRDKLESWKLDISWKAGSWKGPGSWEPEARRDELEAG